MTKQEFIEKYEGWFSYTRREELKKQMESDLDEVFQALRLPLVVCSRFKLNNYDLYRI